MTTQRLAICAASLVACLLSVSTVHALTVAYGQRDIEKADTGCIGGWISDHGDIAYFHGDTARLNRHLVAIARSISEHRRANVILHTGTKTVDYPNEQPVTGLGEQERNQLAVDWSVRRSCPSDDILRGRCNCDRRNVTFDIWIANDIKLDSLSIPTEFTVESGGEIEDFVDRQRTNK